MKSRAAKTALYSASSRACSALLAVGFILALALPAARAAGDKLEDAIELKQAHYFLGNNTVTAAPKAVRIQNTGRLKFVVVAKAPDWRINIYRTDDKTYFSENLKEFAETGLISDFLVSRRDRYGDRSAYRQSPMTFLDRPVIRMTGRRRVFKYIKLPAGMAHEVEFVIYSTYKLTTWGNLPLEEIGRTNGTDFLFGEEKEQRTAYLETSAIRDVKVAPEFFDMPANYKKAKSLREVVAGADTREESVDAQELFNSGRTPPSNKQNQKPQK